MANLPIQRWTTVTESIEREGGRELESPISKVAAVAVLSNPYAGSWEEDLSELTEWGEVLGEKLTSTAVAELGGEEAVESYGKGGIVGVDGEREHVAAILHPELGAPMRDEIGGGEAIIPSTKKMGTPGTTIDVPVHYKDDEWVASHWDAMEVRVPDAPRPSEILIAVVLTDGGRPHPRIGGKGIDDL
ncbi:amino acid synthesis family protein [Haloplanus sp. GCM10025708]|uniref:amino acid synthesis family protein n=1 Tax=Haloferacaceae TaxID=1644056 RepID=UPI0036143A68